MGRAKLQLKLIEDHRKRRLTYRKRLQGLKKKTYELATLCDVPAIMISRDPSSGKIETWPQNVQEVRDVIEMYNGLSTEAQDPNKVDLLGFLHPGLKKHQLQLTPMSSCFGKNLSCLNPDNGLPEPSMEFLDSKLGMIRERIQLLRNQTCLQSEGGAKDLECFEESMVISPEQCKQDSVVGNLSEATLTVDPIDWNQSVSLGCSHAQFGFETYADASAFGDPMEYVEFIDPYVEQQQDFALPAFDVTHLPPLSFESSSQLFPWETSCGEYDTDQTSFGAHTAESLSIKFDSSQLATAVNEEQFCTSKFGLSAVHYQMPAADSNQFVRAGVEEQFCASEFGLGGVHYQMPQAESSFDIHDEYHMMLTSGLYDQANYDRGIQAAMDDLMYGSSSLWN